MMITFFLKESVRFCIENEKKLLMIIHGMITCPKFLRRIHLKPKIPFALNWFDFSKI